MQHPIFYLFKTWHNVGKKISKKKKLYQIEAYVNVDGIDTELKLKFNESAEDGDVEMELFSETVMLIQIKINL